MNLASCEKPTKMKDKKMKSKDKIFRGTMRIILSVPGTGTNN